MYIALAKMFVKLRNLKVIMAYDEKGVGMIKILRKINTIDTWDGETENDSVLTHTDNTIFIARDENNRYGIVDGDESVFLPFGYDSITPLGFNLWQLSKNGKAGALSLKYSDDEVRLCIEWRLPCEYDYLEAESGNLVYASKYSADAYRDKKDIYFVHIDEKIEDAYYDRISWKYYCVSSAIDGERRLCIINSKTGDRHYFDKDYTLIGSKSLDLDEHYLMFEDPYPLSEKGLIVHISREGVISESDLYDKVPTVIYAIDTEGMDDVNPIAFIGMKKGHYYYMDSSLKEYEQPFERMKAGTTLSGRTIDGEEINKEICRFLIKPNVVNVIDAGLCSMDVVIKASKD